MRDVWSPRKRWYHFFSQKHESFSTPNVPPLSPEVIAQALSGGPQAGSFIPCELFSADEPYEKDCILEVTATSSRDMLQCFLHILSNRRTIECHRGFSLRIPDVNQDLVGCQAAEHVELAQIIDTEEQAAHA